MRSYLSQRTFRAILRNKPYFHLRCRQRLALSAPSCAAERHCLYKIQRRYLFGFPTVSPTDIQSGDKQGQSVDHGGLAIRQLAEALEEKSQSTPDAIAKAFSSFIQHRLENPTILTAAQAKFLLWAWEYLDSAVKENQSAGLDLSIAEPEDILNALSRSQWEHHANNDVATLAKSAFRKMCSQLEQEAAAEPFPSQEVLYAYLHILAATGEIREALQIIDNYRSSALRNAGIDPWIPVAKGALKAEPGALNRIFHHMTTHSIQLDQKTQELLTVAAANESAGLASKYIYEYKTKNPFEPTLAATLATANAMIWHGKAGWARDLLTVPRRNPTPEVRDAVLLLAVRKGQEADVVNKKLVDLCSINPDLGSTLTIATFNKLLEFKVLKREYNGIDELISLAKTWGLEPDAFTGMSRVTARLDAGDVPGAMCLWEELDLGELIEGKAVTLWNIIMRQLCQAAQADPEDETVLAFIDRLLESECRLEAATLEELCRMLLLRHDLEGISELLRPFVSSCSVPGLSQVLKPFAQFIADQKESVETAWEVHELLARAVPYAPVGFWTNTMKQFFKRGRPDLACLAFGHMRKKVNPQDRPTAQTYAMCFHGLAKTAYSEGIFLVHNMLKLDVEVQWTRSLLHKLMAAYTACGDPEQAMEFFRHILHSVEGPSYYSITLFFRACATYRKGLQEATQMVEKLKSLNLPLNRRTYNNYIRVLSAHGELERASEAISAMRAETGESPTVATIGLLYNGLPNQKWRDQAESWARIAYPDLWTELEKLPATVDEDGIRSFDLADRDGDGNSQDWAGE
ncbi:mitochondrial respiratory complex I chaperone, variant [Blastomyces gilchristii SLH14081]|uniref:Mitochondrial respiratory complex I chaperone n=1 Tax=Blastomyces gilchristii (strain SLH14081) TaxID=559298 RepID=A0A179UNW2_BLAGS|nr:mitochondrial respiratory complex I chaperone [Blastomyces gilchristii SLH14081]XP_031578949.1 mitochondrial respiratory complex I chaperone, variant [Blastomyces gilchristii SLH14081]OAT09673.1 mitochondrial respiratory complex I chaperone [Blastomyces gilchristii SLH14081]OAT09674.1 mitochondrial respiratory complex I chaperone, variant [Blastomyces gilchristii SLH14081]